MSLKRLFSILSFVKRTFGKTDIFYCLSFKKSTFPLCLTQKDISNIERHKQIALSNLEIAYHICQEKCSHQSYAMMSR